MPSNNLQTGDICLVKFHPGFGQELKKYRPAVIISDKLNTIDQRFVLIAPFTTGKAQNRYELVINHPDLKKTSTLLCWYLWTIDTTRVVQTMGRLSHQDILKLKKVLTQVLL